MGGRGRRNSSRQTADPNHPSSDQWSPRGDVLRCLIDDTEEEQVTITIDEHEMTLTEFGRLLLTHAGWGMRIAFVPDDRPNINPEVESREPDHEPAVNA